MKVPLNREATEYATFELRDMDTDTYMAAQSLIDSKKWDACVMMVLTTLRVAGDEVSRIIDQSTKRVHFIPFQTAMKLINEMMQPVPGELKKK